MKLYFVRHGKTTWNLEGRFQGAKGDSPLLPESISQLKLLGQHLSAIDFDAVFSSDLQRAIDTATIINQENHHPRQIHTHPLLREWHLGRLEGQKIALIADIYPKQMDAFFHNLACFDSSVFEAETVYETTHRLKSFVQELATKDYKNVLIIGHGANLTAGINYLLGYAPSQLRQFGGLVNASLTILETQDTKQFDLIKWNDISYMDKNNSFPQDL